MTDVAHAPASTALSSATDFFWRMMDRCYNHQEVNLSLFSIMAIVCFPLYYVVWEFLFPQPYENLSLRLFGSMIWCAILFRNKIAFVSDKFKQLFYYLTVIYSIPFFFTFMMLENNHTLEWAASNMAGIFLLIFLVDWLNLLVIFALGSIAAGIAYAVTNDEILFSQTYLAQLAIYGFALAGGSILNYRAALFNKERVDTMLSVGGTIAHEMRTPLLGIKSGALGLKRHLPTLIDAYKIARQSNAEVQSIRSAHLDQLAKVADRIEIETEYANMIIDTILMNAGSAAPDWKSFDRHSVKKCVEQALDRYPFKSFTEKSIVEVSNSNDFEFQGSDVVFTHVIFNLLKNSLFFISVGGGDKIRISLNPGKHQNTLTFWDNGSGIPPDRLRHIFDMFYSSGEDAGGTGMGLAFCRMAMESFGGGITVRSKVGEFTELTLSFPVANTVSSK